MAFWPESLKLRKRPPHPPGFPRFEIGEIETRRHRLAPGNSAQGTRLKRGLQLMEAIPEGAEYSGFKPETNRKQSEG